MKPKILVVGSLVMDLIVSSERFPESGESVIGFDFNIAAGGKGANQAVQASRLGAEVTMVGKVGNDSFGRELLDSVSASGVDISHITVTGEAPSAIGNVQLEVTKSRTANRIVVVPGANMKLTAEDVSFLKDGIAGFDMVILQLEIPMEINMLVAEYAYNMNVPVMLNSAPYSPIPEKLYSYLTYISPNEHEAADMTGIRIIDDKTVKTAADSILQKGVKNVIITLGSKGAVIANKNEFLQSPCVPDAAVKDPTAAGDSFVAAFCTAVCSGTTHQQALQFANHTAAITVSAMGAQPSLPEIDAVLELMQNMKIESNIFQSLR
ncbi:MAG: ribokinase [Clostridiales bacterium GWF2_38_85]|nr:MAG: ribokinase [Clostridiales bacterium GWF2_38_85]HBL84243.1 ribokinase [Clostridiales bacterium]